MSTTEPAPSSDELDLHRGLDLELDLASERPSAAVSESPRGPGLMVAAIVASSLALAGVITLVRGDDEPAPAAGVDAAPSEPEVARAVETPSVVEPPAVAARQPAASPSVPQAIRPRARGVVPPPPRVELTPTAIAKPRRAPRGGSGSPSKPAEVTPTIERFDLPAPRFDEPASSSEEPEATGRSPEPPPADVQLASHSPHEPVASAPSSAAEPPSASPGPEPTFEREPEPAFEREPEREPEPTFEPALPSSKQAPTPSAPATPVPVDAGTPR